VKNGNIWRMGKRKKRKEEINIFHYKCLEGAIEK
jgi:hypothetical protein